MMHGVTNIKSYNFSCKVSFLYASWVAERNRVAIKCCFKAGLSATETLTYCRQTELRNF